jgi:hypothetical protein
MRAILALLGLSVALAGLTACPAPASDGRWVSQKPAGHEVVSWEKVGTDFGKLAQPGNLTFVMLTGSHCSACVKAEKTWEKLHAVRPDIALRTVPFPDDICPPDPNPEQKKECRRVVKELQQFGGCFTPTLWAFAPDGSLLARDDTCKDQRPAQDLFQSLARRELKTETL